MEASQFIDDLLELGRVQVSFQLLAPDAFRQGVEDLDRVAREELAAHPPQLEPAVAQWAMSVLYSAAQALVYRDIEADAVRAALSRPCPLAPSPEVCYSADLAFRYLPDLIRLARGIAQEDALVKGLSELAQAWPLSSVGVAGLKQLDVEPFIGHCSLRQLYVDRILQRSDAGRLDHPLVRQAVRQAIGGFRELASPDILATIENEEAPCR